MQQVLVIGNSHTQMISSALQEDLVRVGDKRFDVLWLKTKRHGAVEVSEALARIEELGEDDLLVVTHFGAMHNQIAMFEHDTPWSLVDIRTGAPTPEVGAIVPTALLRQDFIAKVENDVLLKRAAALAKRRIFHFASPPPKRLLFSATKLVKLSESETVTRTFADPRLRLAAWRIEMEVIDAYLAELGVQALEVPSEALYEDGFLRDEYAAQDLTHANAAYGALILRQILDAADRSAAGNGTARQ